MLALFNEKHALQRSCRSPSNTNPVQVPEAVDDQVAMTTAGEARHQATHAKMTQSCAQLEGMGCEKQSPRGVALRDASQPGWTMHVSLGKLQAQRQQSKAQDRQLMSMRAKACIPSSRLASDV
jgi:hypothetical protein